MDHYVEDTDNTFRFHYSKPFLKWALMPPNFIKNWHIGIRQLKTGKLMGFISGIPIKLALPTEVIKMAEINFLCVHKYLRSKRVAPVLIKEVTRRVNTKKMWQALYTVGKTIPTPMAETFYYHRNLNTKKLVDVLNIYIYIYILGWVYWSTRI